MMIAAAPNVKDDDGGNFSADSPPNSDDEQLDDTPFLSHQLPDDHESFSEKFLRNILTHDYQNLMPRRREKFVEITKTVTVTEIVNGAPDKHPSSCEVKVTNVSPAGPHPVNVSIKHLHEKWHSCEELDGCGGGGGDLGKGTVIHIHETHKPFNYSRKDQKSDRFVYEDVVNTKVDKETRAREPPRRDSSLFNRSSDNVIDLEFRHPILVETSEKKKTSTSSEKPSSSNRRRFADLRKRVSTTTKTSMTETEKVTTTRRSSSAHSTSSRRSYGKPEVHTLYYRKFVEEDHKKGDDSSSDTGSVIIHRDSVTRRSRSADPLRQQSPVSSPIAPPRKRLGREESLHFYRDDDEVLEQKETERRVTVRTPEPRHGGNTSVSMNDTFERQNLTAGITSISMNNSCTDTSFESRFSTIPRARSSPPSSQRINHIHVNVIGPMRTPEAERRHPVVGRVGDDVTMDIYIERRHDRSASSSRRASASAEAPPKPPRRSKWEDHHRIGEPLATSTPMTTIERKQTREERTDSEQSSRKSTRSARPPDINIIECETFLRETRSPARTPATPIVVINQTPSSRRSSQDLLGDPAQRRRKSTVTDIDWYAAFNMKDPSSPTKPARPPFGHDERKSSRDVRRRASDSSMIGIPPADIDLNQIFSCTSPQIKKDEKCQCNACRLIRMSEAERASRIVRESRTRQSKSYNRITESRSSTLPSRHRTAPVEIRLEDVFNPKPTSATVSSKPPTPPSRRRQAAPQHPAPPTSSSSVDESQRHVTSTTIDRSQVTTVSTNSRDGSQLHASDQLLSEGVDWVGQMMHDANEWENRTTASRKSSTASSQARKASVARRISVDELTKAEKRKSRDSVSLPPSDVTIDDIFTALTHKKEVESGEKRTFIVTRKQRAQDVDPIDFEKEREIVPPIAPPIAPPRTKKAEENVDPSEAHVVVELHQQPVISTASVTLSQEVPAPIDLDAVFDAKESLKQRKETGEEDERIRRRVAEFERSQQEKQSSRSEETTERTTTVRRTSWENSNISMDDVFNADGKQVEVVVPFEEPTVSSTASIQLEPVAAPSAAPRSLEVDEKPVGFNLDDVFDHGESPDAKEPGEDEKIRRRIAEFERTEQEKRSQKTLEDSEISIDDVFNRWETGNSVEESREISSASINLGDVSVSGAVEPSDQETEDDERIRSRIAAEMEERRDTDETDIVPTQEEPRKTSSAKINLDDVFALGTSSDQRLGDDEEDKKIQRRIAEFQKSQEEKERQTEVSDHSHSSRELFVDSNISMDDVFNQTTESAPEATSAVNFEPIQGDVKDEEDIRQTQIAEEEHPEDPVEETIKRTSAVSIDLDKVFVSGGAPAHESEDEEDKKIRRRVAEFERSQAEKQASRSEEKSERTTTVRRASWEDSNISMDDVFNADGKQVEVVVPFEQPTGTDVPEDAPVVSLAQLNLEALFLPDNSTVISKPSDAEDEKIQHRIEEFEKSQREMRIEIEKTTVEKKHLCEDSDISMDAVFSQPQQPPAHDDLQTSASTTFQEPRVTSAAQLNLEDVFTSTSAATASSKEDEEDRKIQQRVKEFERTQREKEAQHEIEKATTQREHIFEDSDISMDAVFSPSSNQKILEDDIISTPSASTSVVLPHPRITSTAQLNLEDVLTSSRDPTGPSAEDEEEKKIQQRVKEFEKTQKEKEMMTESEKTTVQKEQIFEPSDISIDVVFSPPAHRKITNDDSTATASASTVVPNKTVNSSAQLNLEDVFTTSGIPGGPSEEDEEDKKIRQRVKEFERTQREKELQTEVEKATVQKEQIFSPSDISIDAVFSPTAHDDDSTPILSISTTTVLPHSNVTSTAQFNLEDVFTSTSAPSGPSAEDDEDRKIQQRVREFERTQREKEVQHEVEKATTQREHIFEDSDISMDAVFSPSSNQKTLEDYSVSPASAFTVLPTPTVTSSAQLNLEDVFSPSGASSGPSAEDEEDKKIQQRVKEFEKTQKEKELQTEVGKTAAHKEQMFSPSDISIDAVFSPPARDDDSTPIQSTSNVLPHSNVTSTAQFNLEDVFTISGSPNAQSKENEEDRKIQQRVKEFERTQREKEVQHEVEKATTQREHIFEDSDISMDAVFSPSTNQKIFDDDSVSPASASTVLPTPTVTSSAQLNLEDVFTFSRVPTGPSAEDEDDKKIQQRVKEFERTQKEKEMRTEIENTTAQKEHLFEDSDISMDDIFSSPVSQKAFPSDDASTSTPPPTPIVTSSAHFNLDNVFPVIPKSDELDEEEQKIRKRLEEFERIEKEKKVQRETRETKRWSKTIFSHPDDSEKPSTSSSQPETVTSSAHINLDDKFSAGRKIRQMLAEFRKSQKEHDDDGGEGKTSRRTLEDSEIPLSDVFGFSSASTAPKPAKEEDDEEKTVVITSERETTKTETTTRTETSTDTYTRRTHYPRSDINLEDLFGPQTATPPAIPTVAISSAASEDVTPPRAPLPHKSISNLMVPGKWNESMMSTASTISLDDSFDNSLARSMNEPKMRKPLCLPVSNWIDDFVAKATDEATREAPKTPKTYFPSPTRISQEIKYEWVADLVGVAEEEHQTDEEHLQQQDNTWVSSVVYRPTLETSAYTLRASQPQELDMDKVFSECLLGKKKDDEECECSACRLTEQELEEMRKRKIETENVKRVEGASEESEQTRKYVEVTDPSEFSIDEIFHPEVPLHIQTRPSQVPSTSSPPLENTRTYYLSPKVSETVTTTHQWKDADISMDEIFSPVSSTTNDNRRFSNFYEDRSGWDTMGSEDSGVMSGGDRGRRRSSRTAERVIDEAFKDIFETQPTSSSFTNKQEQTETNQYDDYYITSLNEGYVEPFDSEVDGDNLDVTQFVDDILGKSLDEAAFLSSTKSLRDHTDTSIDRKKPADRVHPYYRTRTDTSIDRRMKPAVIDEETHESTDEILKLVFVDRSLSTSQSRGSLSKATAKPNDEELLEIEIKPEYFLIKGSYSLLIPKSEPLGQMLQKLRDQNDSLATLDFSLTRKLKKLLVNCIREKADSLQMASSSSSSKYEGLSSRGQSLIESIDHASSTFLRMNVDKFEPTRNPRGIVNFCTAENNICTPLLEERFKHLELFFPNTEHLVRYPPAGGWPEAREVLVKYFKEFMGARVATEELVLTASTRTGYDVVSYCLFEQDDILLTNGPVYTGTISNVQERALCQVECVPTDLSNPRLDVKLYEEALARQTALDNTVSGIIIVNPHNPLGVVFPPEEVVTLCNWAAAKNLHVVIDEVFANCVFDKPASKFRPFLSYRHRVHRPENIAWLWSVSKDFGLPGLKFAVIHSANEGLRKAAMKLQLYHPCSPFVQDFAVKLLSDSEWLREFHTEVTRRMAIHYRYTADNLSRLEIPFVPAQAGIFVFADFSKHLASIDELGELSLFERLGSAGVMLTPGVHQKCHQFGWFRLVFACSKQELEEGFRRLFQHLGSQLQPIGTVNYDIN